MAPVAKLVARDIETDAGFMLLYYSLKNIEEGKPNFSKVAESMGLSTGTAAAKRYARLIKVQDDAESGITGNSEAVNPKATPKKAGGKKKVDGGEEIGNCAGGDSPSPQKKQRVTKSKKTAAGKASLAEDKEEEKSVADNEEDIIVEGQVHDDEDA